MDELNMVYDPIENEIKCMFWSDTMVWEAVKAKKGKQPEKNKLIDIICNSEMLEVTLEKNNEII